MKHYLIELLAKTPKLNHKETGIPKLAADANALQGILTTVYMIAGIVAVGAIIYGAFMYSASGGNPEMVKRGKNVILYACVGLVIVVMAWAITSFIIGRL